MANVDPIKDLFLKDDEEVTTSLSRSEGLSAPERLNKNQKSFVLNMDKKLSIQDKETAKPSGLMDLIKEQSGKNSEEIVKEEFGTDLLDIQMKRLQGELDNFNLFLRDSSKVSKLEKERQKAVSLVMDLVSEDIDSIAEETKQDKIGKRQQEDFAKGALSWVSSAEEILGQAMIYLSDKKGEPSNLVDFLRLQYAVQRATQRAELFASIVGTSVSSIKTILTTQLG